MIDEVRIASWQKLPQCHLKPKNVEFFATRWRDSSHRLAVVTARYRMAETTTLSKLEYLKKYMSSSKNEELKKKKKKLKAKV